MVDIELELVPPLKEELEPPSCIVGDDEADEVDDDELEDEEEDDEEDSEQVEKVEAPELLGLKLTGADDELTGDWLLKELGTCGPLPGLGLVVGERMASGEGVTEVIPGEEELQVVAVSPLVPFCTVACC